MSSGLAAINRALNLIPKRAESRQAERLRDTFVDSGVAAALEAIDHQVHDEALVADVVFIRKLDDLLAAITTIRIVGDVELFREGEQKDTETTGAGVRLGFGPKPSAEVWLSTQGAEERRELLRETRRGTEQRILNFSDVARALRELASTLATRRVWLLLDEWSSVPPEIQPFLGGSLVRCVLPLQMSP